MHLSEHEVRRQQPRLCPSRLSEDGIRGGVVGVVRAGQRDPRAAIDERASWRNGWMTAGAQAFAGLRPAVNDTSWHQGRRSADVALAKTCRRTSTTADQQGKVSCAEVALGRDMGNDSFRSVTLTP
jgi:hypothetical protein